MNNRMLDLIEESRDLVPTQTKVGSGMYIPGPLVRGDVNLQRFAELIVKECIEIVEKNESEIHYDNGMYPVYSTVCEIKEHFGVEL